MHEFFSEESTPRYATFCPRRRAAVENVPASAETRRPGMRAPDQERRRARITGGSRWAMLGQERQFAPGTSGGDARCGKPSPRTGRPGTGERPPEKTKAGSAVTDPACKQTQIRGGEEEDRTPDLRIANAALSQLSYPPDEERIICRFPQLFNQAPAPCTARRRRSATAAQSAASGIASTTIRSTPAWSSSRRTAYSSCA